MTAAARALALSIAGVVLLPRSAGAQESPPPYSPECEDYFDRLLASFGGAEGARYIATTSSSGRIGTQLSVAARQWEDGTDAKFVALEVSPPSVGWEPEDSTIPFTPDEGVRIAVCCVDPWYPPPIVVQADSAFALYNAVWSAPNQAMSTSYSDADGQEIESFILSSGFGVFIENSRIDASALDSDTSTTLLFLDDAEATYGSSVQELTVEGDTDALVLLRQHTADGAFPSRAITVADVEWPGVEGRSALYRAGCSTGGADKVVRPCEEGVGSDTTLHVKRSSFGQLGASDAIPALSAPFIESVGDVDLEGTVIQGLAFDGAHPAVWTRGGLSLRGATAIVDLDGGGGAHPALKASGGTLSGDTLLLGDLRGWGSVAFGRQQVEVQQSLLCGISDTDVLLQTQGDDSTTELLSSAVYASQLDTALVAAPGDGAQALLANVLVRDVTGAVAGEPLALGDGDAAASAPLDLSLANLLAADSLLRVGNTATASASASRSWAGGDATLCDDPDLRGSCGALGAAVEFTSEPQGDAALPTPTCGGDLEGLIDLLQQEADADALAADADTGAPEVAAVDPGASLQAALPILYADQLDLVDGGRYWQDAEARDSDDAAGCFATSQLGIGAYNGGGSCTLSFLAPVVGSTEPDEEPPDTGAPAAALPDGRLTAAGGCRWLGSASALLLPLGLLARRRRRRDGGPPP